MAFSGPADKPLPLTECPSCGVIFAKFLVAQEEKRKRVAEQESQAARAAEKAAAKTKPAPLGEPPKAKPVAATLANCPSCGGLVAIGATACPHCGRGDPAPVPKQSTKGMKWATAILVVVAILWTMDKSPSAPSRPPITNGQKALAQAAIKAGGYRCDDVSHISPLLTKPGYRITCNAGRYVYNFIDEGGR